MSIAFTCQNEYALNYFYGVYVNSMVDYTNIFCVLRYMQAAFGFIMLVHSLREL